LNATQLPIIQDGRDLAHQTLVSFSGAVDSLFANTTADIPKAEGDLGTSLANYIEAHLSPSAAVYAKMILGIAVPLVSSALPALTTPIVAELANLQKSADQHIGQVDKTIEGTASAPATKTGV
jgi:hypothetical protein